MNGTDRYLIDTNILIYFLQGEEVAASFFKNIMDKELCISLINTDFRQPFMFHQKIHHFHTKIHRPITFFQRI